MQQISWCGSQITESQQVEVVISVLQDKETCLTIRLEIGKSLVCECIPLCTASATPHVVHKT